MAYLLFTSTREYLTPVLTESQFYEKGMITPQEFEAAGDHLIRNCPSWKWESGEPSKHRNYLKPNKQFLSTKGVPSYSRATSIQKSQVVENSIQGGMGEKEGDWCSTELVENNYDEGDEVLIEAEDAMDPSETSTNKIEQDEQSKKESVASKPEKSNANIDSNKKDDKYDDMCLEEDDSLALDDVSQVLAATNINSENEAIIKSRRYDVSITYDNYYRVPRIWLFGFDENGTPLSTEEIYQDVIQDYAKRTVTVDPHPHLSHQHASIHPCQHATAMLSILEALKESEVKPPVEQYIYFFLKFLQSVIPTIEYDYTTEVQVRKM